jgi:hypothetical protein
VTIELPPDLIRPLEWVSVPWPQANEDRLTTDAKAWIGYGGTLRAQAAQAQESASMVWLHNAGPSVEEFERWWNAPDRPGKTLHANADAADLIGAGLLAMAAATVTAKVVIVTQLVSLSVRVREIMTAGAHFIASTAISDSIAETRADCRRALDASVSTVEYDISAIFAKAAELLHSASAPGSRPSPAGPASGWV